MPDFGMFTPSRPLRVGTDCSGIEAPIVALQQLGIPFSHEFSSEIDKHCIATIKANFHPKIIFGDMTQRPLKDIPDIDLYVCGFPCQPFSMAGKREGVRDPRGTIFWECLRVIRYKKPIVFILENVPGIISIDQGETFRMIIESLQRLKMYKVQWKILNTADYGIPQSRKRVFIVGIKKKEMKQKFEWPTPVICRPLREFVDWGDRTRHPLPPHAIRSGILQKPPKNAVFVDLSYAKDRFPNSDKICPCLTTSSHRFYNMILGRLMTVYEMMMLQGFPKSFIVPVAKHHAIRQIGNSMSVNVIKMVIKNDLRTVG